MAEYRNERNRDLLFEPGKAWGIPAKETEQTKGRDNMGIIDVQNQIMAGVFLNFFI
jgi:hypothetical protein